MTDLATCFAWVTCHTHMSSVNVGLCTRAVSDPKVRAVSYHAIRPRLIRRLMSPFTTTEQRNDARIDNRSPGRELGATNATE